VLLNNYAESEVPAFLAWLKTQSSTPTACRHVSLSSPTNFREIYQAATNVIVELLETQGPDIDLSFHLSPGTPAMAAVWILLGKTRFPAELLQSSREEGLHVADIPFDIAADFIPDLLRPADHRLEELSAGALPQSPAFADIIHRSPEMTRVLLRAQRVALRSVPVLLEGESGTGKELLARAIHNAGPRKNKPFVAINCGAIPAELVESELFGHTKGAFTGATHDRQGVFASAQDGTVFLDEIGELPLPIQVKMLRVLQEGEVTPVGTATAVAIKARIIAATNRTLTDEIASGAFRSDLFYRLAVAILKLPSLRERQGDLSLLIDHLLAQVNRESTEDPGYQHKEISASAKNILLQHSWPGNVRELLNTLRRAAIWAEETSIGVEDIRDALLPAGDALPSDVLNSPLGNGFQLSEKLALVARHYLERAIEESQGNKSLAARLVGASNYQTLTNWLKKYQVSVPSGTRTA
jgi:transcriptional regulator with PAS, ATPase and Fis domain